MNAYCATCRKRTSHRRTQFGAVYRFWCQICGTELSDTSAHLEEMRKPSPNQSAIDAAAAEALSRLPGPVRMGWKGD
jgi:hypothetical protein